jgi:hypothetical protein
VIYVVCTLALLKTRKFCYAALCVRACGEGCFTVRVHSRWPLATSAINMPSWYTITSYTTEQHKNVCNILGPRVPLPDRWAPVICTGFPSLIGTSWNWFMESILWGYSVFGLDVIGPCWMIYSRCWIHKDSMWTWQDRPLKRQWKIGQRKSKTSLTFHGKILPHIC